MKKKAVALADSFFVFDKINLQVKTGNGSRLGEKTSLL
jgi:ribosomal 30S subunit maturation factor RimM